MRATRPRRAAATPPIGECTFAAAPVWVALVPLLEVEDVDSEEVVEGAALEESVELEPVAVILES
jgi:hypothetical protein